MIENQSKAKKANGFFAGFTVRLWFRLIAIDALRSGVPQAPPVLTSSVPAPLALLAPGVGDCHPRAARVSPACAPRPCPGWLAPASLHRWLHPFPVSFTLHAFMGGVFSAPTAITGGTLATVAQAFAIPLLALRAPLALAVQSMEKSGKMSGKMSKKMNKKRNFSKKIKKNQKKKRKKIKKGVENIASCDIINMR